MHGHMRRGGAETALACLMVGPRLWGFGCKLSYTGIAPSVLPVGTKAQVSQSSSRCQPHVLGFNRIFQASTNIEIII